MTTSISFIVNKSVGQTRKKLKLQRIQYSTLFSRIPNIKNYLKITSITACFIWTYLHFIEDLIVEMFHAYITINCPNIKCQ